MNENIYKRNDLLAKKVIKGLESRNMTGYYAKSAEEALSIALDLIPEGSKVTMGGCMSAAEIGLVDAVKEGNYTFLDRHAYEDPRQALLEGYDTDVFLASANAMTLIRTNVTIAKAAVNQKECRKIVSWRARI